MAKKKKPASKPKKAKSKAPKYSSKMQHLMNLHRLSVNNINGTSKQLDELFIAQAERLSLEIDKLRKKECNS